MFFDICSIIKHWLQMGDTAAAYLGPSVVYLGAVPAYLQRITWVTMKLKLNSAQLDRGLAIPNYPTLQLTEVNHTSDC
jgi:hypothetical protein